MALAVASYIVVMFVCTFVVIQIALDAGRLLKPRIQTGYDFNRSLTPNNLQGGATMEALLIMALWASYIVLVSVVVIQIALRSGRSQMH